MAIHTLRNTSDTRYLVLFRLIFSLCDYLLLTYRLFREKLMYLAVYLIPLVTE